MKKIRAIVALMRVKHWLKNALVLFPILFGRGFFEGDRLAASLLGFLAFCVVSSGVYAVNDLKDAERDRLNPQKAHRPIASGALSQGEAGVIAAILFALGGSLSLLACTYGGADMPGAMLSLVAYIVLNLVYSAGLKHVAIVDIAILASGYFLRVLYGSFVTGIDISMWLYLTIISLSFYFGLGKRRGELRSVKGEGAREVLRKYPDDFLSSNMTVFFTLGLVFYSLWATDLSATGSVSQYMAWTIPLVFLVCLRYSYLIERGGSGDPVEVVFGDKPLLGMVALFAVAVAVIILYL